MPSESCASKTKISFITPKSTEQDARMLKRLPLKAGTKNVDPFRAQATIGKGGANAMNNLTAGERQAPTAEQPVSDLKRVMDHGAWKIWFKKMLIANATGMAYEPMP